MYHICDKCDIFYFNQKDKRLDLSNCDINYLALFNFRKAGLFCLGVIFPIIPILTGDRNDLKLLVW